MLRGVVSDVKIDPIRARVTFKERDNRVSAFLKIAEHVGTLKIGDNVVVAFFSDNSNDGLIIAKYREGDEIWL